MNIKDSFRKGKKSKHELDHYLRSVADVYSTWGFSSTSPVRPHSRYTTTDLPLTLNMKCEILGSFGTFQKIG
jgi:hypothetical protein